MTKIKPLQALKLKLPKNFRSMKFVKIRKKWMVSVIQLLFRLNFSDKLIKFHIYCPLTERGKSFALKAEVGLTITAVSCLLFFMSVVFVLTTGIVFSLKTVWSLCTCTDIEKNVSVCPYETVILFCWFLSIENFA